MACGSYSWVQLLVSSHGTQWCTGAQALFQFSSSSDGNGQNHPNPKTCPPFRIPEIKKMRFFTLLPSARCLTDSAITQNCHLSMTFDRTAVMQQTLFLMIASSIVSVSH
jgi:hypothetical protein